MKKTETWNKIRRKIPAYSVVCATMSLTTFPLSDTLQSAFHFNIAITTISVLVFIIDLVVDKERKEILIDNFCADPSFWVYECIVALCGITIGLYLGMKGVIVDWSCDFAVSIICMLLKNPYDSMNCHELNTNFH